MGKRHRHNRLGCLHQFQKLRNQQHAFQTELSEKLKLLDAQWHNLVQGQQFFQQALLQANMANLPPNIATANLTTLPPGYNLPPAFNQQSNNIVAYNNAKIDELSAKEERRREQRRVCWVHRVGSG